MKTKAISNHETPCKLLERESKCHSGIKEPEEKMTKNPGLKSQDSVFVSKSIKNEILLSVSCLFVGIGHTLSLFTVSTRTYVLLQDLSVLLFQIISCLKCQVFMIHWGHLGHTEN